MPLRQSRPYQSRAFTSSWHHSPMARSQKFQLDLPFSTGKILSANQYSSTILVYISSSEKLENLFALGVVVDVYRCWLFFSFGVVDYCFCTYNMHLMFTPWYCLLLGDPHTHVARVSRWRASLHTEMLVVGGWCWCWWDQPTHAPSDAPSKPFSHQLTPVHPTAYPPSHHARFLCRRVFTMEAIRRLLLKQSKSRRTADIAAWCS